MNSSVTKRNINWTAIYWLSFALCIGLVVFLSLFRLGDVPVVPWDEARHGVNAYEMWQRKNFIANYFDGALDFWNLKPPLSYYFIMLGYQIFGYNAWGLRFFSALAFIGSVTIIALFLRQHVGRVASIAFLVFSCGCTDFFMYHFVRAGDADALYLFFLTVCLVTLYLSRDNVNWLYLTAINFALAFLTKSFHILMIAPVILVFFLVTKTFQRLKWWQYLTIGVVLLCPILVYVIARWSFDGWQFLRAMFVTDVWQRSTDDREGYKNVNLFYTRRLLNNPVTAVCLLLVVIFLMKTILRKEKWSAYEILTFSCFVSLFTCFAIAKTKLDWYVYPISWPLIMLGAHILGSFWQDPHWHAVWRWLLCATCALICVVMAGITTYRVVNVSTSEELQTVIASLPVTPNASYFYQNRSITTLGQQYLLVLEWRTGQRLTADGMAGFWRTNNAYLILCKANIADWQDLNVVAESDNFIVLYQA